MVDLQLDINRSPDRAFEYADRSKARTLIAAMSGTDRPVPVQRLADIQAQLPPTVVLIVYAALADRLLIWSVTTDSAALTEQPVFAATLTRQVSRLRQAILDRRDSADVNQTLFETLIRPAQAAIAGKTTAVFVPDGALHLLPFAALRDPTTARYLIEDRAIASTPSASFFATAIANARERTSTGLTSALLVGNPADSYRSGPPWCGPGSQRCRVDLPAPPGAPGRRRDKGRVGFGGTDGRRHPLRWPRPSQRGIPDAVAAAVFGQSDRGTRTAVRSRHCAAPPATHSARSPGRVQHGGRLDRPRRRGDQCRTAVSRDRRAPCRRKSIGR